MAGAGLRQRARMAERPMWEQVGTSFVHLYYQHFDSSRVELRALYDSLSQCFSWTSAGPGDFPDTVWEGSKLVPTIKKTDASCFSWEGQQFQGKTAIMEKLMSLPFQKIQHSITSQDHQPAPDNCILSMVLGQLKVDNDPVMGFHQLFVLKNISDNWVCTNDIFRLALYNFA